MDRFSTKSTWFPVLPLGDHREPLTEIGEMHIPEGHRASFVDAVIEREERNSGDRVARGGLQRAERRRNRSLLVGSKEDRAAEIHGFQD
jgi:hypothetical protein